MQGGGRAGEPSRIGRQEDRGTGIPRLCQPGLNLRTGSVISVLGELGQLPLLLSFFICKAGMMRRVPTFWVEVKFK